LQELLAQLILAVVEVAAAVQVLTMRGAMAGQALSLRHMSI
jgi:hypothetical protein